MNTQFISSLSLVSFIEAHFLLICENREAASGNAIFAIDDNTFKATLSVKMGGKNMQFTQQISGSRIGNCI